MYISMAIELTSVLVYDNTIFPPFPKWNLIPSAAYMYIYMHALDCYPTWDNMSATCFRGYIFGNQTWPIHKLTCKEQREPFLECGIEG